MRVKGKWSKGEMARTIVVYLLQLITTVIVWACALASSGFYLWKAKNENRAKYAQKYMDKWAEKYGPEAAARIAEIVLRD